MQNTMTRAWELYELGRAYNNQLEPNQYSLVNTNIEFYQGNQWLHMPDTPAMRRLPKPPGTIMPSASESLASQLSPVRFSESTQSMHIWAPWAQAACLSASATER